MLKSLILKHVGPAAEMRMEPMAPRFNLLTGDNGLGKTFLLDAAWFVLAGRWPGYRGTPPAAHADDARIDFECADDFGEVDVYWAYNKRSQDWTIIGEPDGESTYPLRSWIGMYVRSDGSVHIDDPQRGNAIRRQEKKMFDFDAGKYQLNRQEIWDGKDKVCNGFIRDVALWQTGKDDRFKVLKKVVAALSPDPTKPLEFGELTRVWLSDPRDMPTIRQSYEPTGEPLVLASSAIRTVLSWAYLLVWAWDEHKRAVAITGEKPSQHFVLMFDEIETHLHPKWQRAILPALMPAIQKLTGGKGTTVQVLAATHSPLVLASAEPLFDARKDALWLLDEIGGEVKLVRDEWHKRGDVNRWLRSDVFDLKSASSIEAEEAISAASKAMERDEPDWQEVDRITQLLIKALPEFDPFLTRWNILLEKRRRH